MVNTLEITDLIDKFDQKLSSIAFHYKSPLKLYKIGEGDGSSVMEAKERLREFIRMSKNNQISFTDYNQMQEFMKANSIIEMALKLPTVEEVKEIIIDGQRPYFFYSNLKETFNEWHAKEEYIRIPQAIVEELKLKNINYIKLYNNMSDQQKTAFLPILKKMLDPKEVFKTATEEADRLVLFMLRSWGDVQKDKSQYIGNTYMAYKEIKKIYSKDHEKAYFNILFWTLHGFDPRYVLDLDIWDQKFANFADKQIQMEKNKRQKAKREQEEKEKIIEKDRQAAKKQFDDPERQKKMEEATSKYEEMFEQNSTFLTEIETKAMQYKKMVDELRGLGIEPSDQELQDLRGKIDGLYKEGENALATLNNLSNDMGIQQ